MGTKQPPCINLVDVTVQIMQRKYPSIPPSVFQTFAAQLILSAAKAACVDSVVVTMPGMFTITNSRTDEGKLVARVEIDPTLTALADMVKPVSLEDRTTKTKTSI